MSRAYRIKVSESIRRVIRADDHVSTQLELLRILPAEQMAELLAAQLQREGFQRDGGQMRREEPQGIEVLVDLGSGTVRVAATRAADVELSGEESGIVYDDVGPSEEVAKEQLRSQLRSSLEQDVQRRSEALQEEVTRSLENALRDIRQVLDRAVNRSTAEALKRKAAQLGQIKQISEESNGSLTIVVEV